jgi:hypothetical protein
MKCFKIKKYEQGTQISSASDHIDTYNLIVRGSVGVFFPDPDKIKGLPTTRLIKCNDSQAEQLREEQKRAKLEQRERLNSRNRTLEEFTKLIKENKHARRNTETNPLHTLVQSKILKQD